MSGALDLLVVKLPDFVRTTTFRWISIAFAVCILLFSAFVYALGLAPALAGRLKRGGALPAWAWAERTWAGRAANINNSVASQARIMKPPLCCLVYGST